MIPKHISAPLLSLSLALAAAACESSSSSAPPPPGMAGVTGAGANPAGFGAAPPNPHGAAPANPHGAAPANPHGAMGMPPGAPAGDGPKVSPFASGAATVVKGDRPADAAPAAAPGGKGVIAGTVVESMNAAGYTYLLVKDGSGNQVWAAVNQTELAAGATVSISESLTMTDFHSKTLNRTFPAIVFGTLN